MSIQIPLVFGKIMLDKGANKQSCWIHILLLNFGGGQWFCENNFWYWICWWYKVPSEHMISLKQPQLPQPKNWEPHNFLIYGFGDSASWAEFLEDIVFFIVHHYLSSLPDATYRLDKSVFKSYVFRKILTVAPGTMTRRCWPWWRGRT